MSIREHLAELERRHADLEREIHNASLHPSVDSIEIGQMKRKKLKLKEEISRIRVSS